jgi:hypothetical protein
MMASSLDRSRKRKRNNESTPRTFFGRTKSSPEAHWLIMVSLGFSFWYKKPVMPKKKLFVAQNGDYSMYSTFLTASPGSVLFTRSNQKGSVLLVTQTRSSKAW